MNNAISQLSNKIQYLNPALKKIAAYVLDNPEESKTITTKELAAACGVAESTITRFVKEIGYASFQEFKISLAEAITLSDQQGPVEENAVYEDIEPGDSTEEIVEKVFFQNVSKLQAARDLINPAEVKRAAALIDQAENLIFISTGSSSVAANEGIVRFTRAGKRCIFWSDLSMQMMVSSTLGEKDLVIGISDSGKTTSVLDALKMAKAGGAGAIFITSDFETKMTGLCDVVLYTPPRLSKGQNHWESMTSKNAQIMIIDVLYACFALDNYEETLENLNKTYQSVKFTRG